jgi:lauroyl/myristoyl acyltransferase
MDTSATDSHPTSSPTPPSLFRQPNNPHAASHVANARKEISKNLIASDSGAAFKLVTALERNEHVGLLVDQKFRRGIKIPLIYDCQD